MRSIYQNCWQVSFFTDSTEHIRDPPESWYIEIPLKRVPARLLWYGLAPSTRKTYTTATNSYTESWALFGKRAFPAQIGELTAWIGHLEGRRLKPKTIKGYLAGLWSLCLDCTLDKTELEVYSYPILQRIIAGLQRWYGERDTHERRPITRNILLWLISRFDQITFEGVNLHAAFCLAFAGFLRMGEFTYDKVKCNFNSWNLTRGSVSLSENRLFLVFPASKTDPFRRGVTLTILAATDEACAIKSLRNLFGRFPKAHHHPLFSKTAGTFSRNYITKKLQERISILGYKGNYMGHSFWREVATSVRLAGLFEEEIQFLGRWKSNSYRLYIETYPNWIHNASRRHQLTQRMQPLPAPPPLSNPPTPPLIIATRIHTRSQIQRLSRPQ